MSFLPIKYCPSTLSKGFSTYSGTALKKVFYGKKVSHILPFLPPQLNEEVAEIFRQNRKILSISGVQIKQSLRLAKNELKITKEGEQGQYILKPIPHRETIGKTDQLPANEHVTMQIATQVYKMNVAENALVFFNNGEPTYITKRFDVKKDGTKIGQEDFASLMGRTKETHGDIFKNEGSYEAMASVMKKFIGAYPVEIEKFFTLIIFNYVTLNGDAHLKNFSVQMTENGDYILSPAYDLINTRIHIPEDTAMALTDGLFNNDYETASFKANAFYAYDDFLEFGLKIGMVKSRIDKILDRFRNSIEEVRILIYNSYLDDDSKTLYVKLFTERISTLSYSYKKLL